MSTRKPPAKLSPADFKARQAFQEREQAILTGLEELQQAHTLLQGEWSYWRREVIAPRYSLTEYDTFADDGTIERQS